MSERSSIEWTDATWNPIRGVKGKWSCVKVSPGCANCYAERMNVRFRGPAYKAGADDLRLDEKVLTEPLRWKKPRRVFVCSMTDLFERRVHTDWIGRAFTVMAQARRQQFQVLTKHPRRMSEALTSAHFISEADGRMPLSNVWLGISAEDQKHLDERAPWLQHIPAAIRFLSLEPLLGPIDLGPLFGREPGYDWRPCCCAEIDPADRPCMVCENRQEYGRESGIGWVIVGGESGPGARPMELAWARAIVRECKAAAVPVFVKQLGAWIKGPVRSLRPNLYRLTDGRRFSPPIIGASSGRCPYEYDAFSLFDSKGGDPTEWPKDLRVREWPGGSGV